MDQKREELNKYALEYAKKRMEIPKDDRLALFKLRSSEEWTKACKLAMSYIKEYRGKSYFYNRVLFENEKTSYSKKIFELLDSYIPKPGATFYSYFSRAMINLSHDAGREAKRYEGVFSHTSWEEIQNLDLEYQNKIENLDFVESEQISCNQEDGEQSRGFIHAEDEQAIHNEEELAKYYKVFRKFGGFCSLLEDEAELDRRVKKYQDRKPRYRVFCTRDYIFLVKANLSLIEDEIEKKMADQAIASIDETVERVFSQPYMVFLRSNNIQTEDQAIEAIIQKNLPFIRAPLYRYWIQESKLNEDKYMNETASNGYFGMTNLSADRNKYLELKAKVFEMGFSGKEVLIEGS